MKKSPIPAFLAAAAAFCAFAAAADEPAAQPVPEGLPPAGAARPAPVARPGQTPEEAEHSRRMKALATVRDTKLREAEAIEEEIRARKTEILKENEEAGDLARKILALREELGAATNALEKIFLADEPLQARIAQARQARETAGDRQRALNQEVAEAMRRRMEERRSRNPAPRPTASATIPLPAAGGTNAVSGPRPVPGFAPPPGAKAFPPPAPPAGDAADKPAEPAN